ncbi:MAG TPA: VOC family protein [Burkholderiales bacterium]|nr:VOC family protein [Burkholderiales bacterium]
MARIVHLAIKVDDLEAASRFYEEVFGFRHTETNSKRGHTSRHLTDGTFDLALVKYESETTTEADYAGPGPRLHHFGIAVDKTESFEEALRRHGCEILSKPGVLPIKFRAPGGVVAEISKAEDFPGVG